MKILDSTFSDAKAAGCDTVQFKYDGMPAQFTLVKGTLRTVNFSFRDLGDPILGLDPTVNCTLIGTYLPVPNLRMIFDCWCVQEGDTYVDLRAEPYRSRFVAAKIQGQMIGTVVKLVTNHPISKAHDLWSQIPALSNVKGLVFRDSRAPASAPARVARYYKEAPKELL